MRITRYSRSSGRGAYYPYRTPANPYRRRGGLYDGPPPSARGFSNSQSQQPFSVRHGHGDRRTRLISPDDRLAYRARMMRMVRDTLYRRSRSRERYRDDLRRTSRSRDRSLSSVLSDISSGSSCFGAVRASEAYGSPVYEDLTEDEIQSLELEDEEEEEDEDGEEQTSSSAAAAEMVVAPPMVRHKKRKKDKKKKEKVKERERKRAKKERRRQKEILEERICPPEHEVAQSKEIFASGQNILVSVSFIDSEKTSEREKYKKNKHRKKLRRQKMRGKVTTVPKEETLPKADRGSSQGSAGGASVPADEKNNVPQGKLLQETQHSSLEHHQQQQQSIIQPPPAKKKKLDPAVKPVMVIDLERSPSGQVISSPREVIVLSDEDGKRARGTEEAKPNDIDLNNRGPNTPPEPAPKSPDSYDPFQPTKSSPRSGISTNDIGSISTISFQEPRHLHLDEQKDEVKAEFHHPHHHLHPHSHHHHHHHHHHGQHHHGHAAQERLLAPTEHTSGSGGFNDDSILDLHPESPFEKLDVNSPRTVGTSAHHFHQSPMKAIIKSMPKKLLAAGNSRDSRPHSAAIKSNQTGTGTTTGGGTVAATSAGVPFEDELNDGDISPYSPRSSDCDAQLFEPPQDGNGETQTIALTVDNLRRVFGNDPKTLYGDLRKSYQHRSVIAVDEMYKPHKMTLEMLDEIPDSAVDMQVKEKLIKKLQRQERIVEEVKHFLKPHFNKKRIDKDEYKEIMRKSIPKICHSRSGEINPAKIQALITAYVKKAIAKRKLLGIEIGSSSGTPLANISYVPSTTAAPTIPPLSASEPAPSVVLMNR